MLGKLSNELPPQTRFEAKHSCMLGTCLPGVEGLSGLLHKALYKEALLLSSIS